MTALLKDNSVDSAPSSRPPRSSRRYSRPTVSPPQPQHAVNSASPFVRRRARAQANKRCHDAVAAIPLFHPSDPVSTAAPTRRALPSRCAMEHPSILVPNSTALDRVQRTDADAKQHQAFLCSESDSDSWDDARYTFCSLVRILAACVFRHPTR